MAKREGVWFLAEFEGNFATLAKAKGHKALDTEARNNIMGKGWVEVEVSYDFFSPLRPIPMTDPRTGQIAVGPGGQPIMGIGRESVVTGNHFMLEPCPSYVRTANAKKLTFVEDMKDFDKTKYNEFISQAEVNLEEQRKAQSPLHFVDKPKDARLPVGADGAIDLSKLRTG